MSKPPITSVKNSQIAALEHDGVVKISGLLNEDWIARMQRAVDDVLAGPSSRGAELKSDGTPGRFAYDNYLFAFNEDFRAMALESPAAEVAALIMGASRINVVFDFILVKEPNTPAETVWHQDISANPCEGLQVCGMWISLDEVTAESGAVEWVRGSHRWGRRFEAMTTGDPDKHTYLTGHRSHSGGSAGVSDATEPVPDVANNRADFDIITIDTSPGDAIISSLSMVHGAPGNRTDRRRRAFGYRFAGDDASYAVRSSRRSIQPHQDPKLEHGDPFPADPNHAVFPMVWSRGGNAARSAAE